MYEYIDNIDLANRMLHEICKVYEYTSCDYEYLKQHCNQSLKSSKYSKSK